MLPVAALLAVGGRPVTVLAVILALAGGVLMLLFQGAGARVPHFYASPLREVVWPVWQGHPDPSWKFEQNLVGMFGPREIVFLPSHWLWVQFIPLVAGQLAAIVALARCCRGRSANQMIAPR
jgi:hypothetical protein